MDCSGCFGWYTLDGEMGGGCRLFKFASCCVEDGWFVSCCDVDNGCRRREVVVTGSGIGDCSSVIICSSVELGWATDNSGSGKVGVVTT